MATTTTLNDFFPIDSLSDKKLGEIIASEDFKQTKERIIKELKGIPVPDRFYELLIKQINEVLNIDIRAILISAWTQTGEFLKYVNPADHPPEEPVLVALKEHKITSEHYPIVKPYLNKIPLREIQFHILLELTLKAVVLKIKNGRIMEVLPGACQGAGSVKLGETELLRYPLLQKDSGMVTLPVSIELEDGIPIQEPLEKVHQTLDKIIKETGIN